MNKQILATCRKISAVLGLLLIEGAPPLLRGEPRPAAVNGFNAYTGAVESRLAQQHRSPGDFLVPTVSLGRGELIVERVAEPSRAEVPGALLHHWRGTAFAPGAKAADFERLLRDFDVYPQHFAPQVLQARVLSREGDRMQATMRVRQRHVITVVMDATYDISFGRLDEHNGYSISRSTRIAEIDSPGTNAEHALNAGEEHGFLWRLNTYWSWQERDGGLYLQIEAVSLTRGIPFGLGWAIRPYVESIPRESLEFTLRSAVNALLEIAGKDKK